VREETSTVLCCLLTGIVSVKEQNDLIEAHHSFELMLEGFLGPLGTIGQRTYRPVLTDLIDAEAVEFAFCNYKGLTLTPKLLTKEGMVFILSCPSKVLVSVPAFVSNELTSLRIVRKAEGL